MLIQAGVIATIYTIQIQAGSADAFYKTRSNKGYWRLWVEKEYEMAELPTTSTRRHRGVRPPRHALLVCKCREASRTCTSASAVALSAPQGAQRPWGRAPIRGWAPFPTLCPARRTPHPAASPRDVSTRTRGQTLLMVLCPSGAYRGMTASASLILNVVMIQE